MNKRKIQGIKPKGNKINKKIDKQQDEEQSISDRLAVYLSNFYLFIQQEDTSRQEMPSYYKLLVFIFFIQLFGLITSIQPTYSIYSTTFQFAVEFPQISPALALWKNEYQMIIAMLLLLIQDLLFLYYSVFLCKSIQNYFTSFIYYYSLKDYFFYLLISQSYLLISYILDKFQINKGISSTKDSSNNFKRLQSKTKFILIEMDLLKWIMIIIKSDFMFGWFFCSHEWSNSSTSSVSKRCMMLPQIPTNIKGGIFVGISVILMLSSLLIIFLYGIIYNQVEMKTKNMLKTNFTYTKMIELIGIMGIVMASYFGSHMVMMIISYFIFHFPFPSRDISLFYLNCMTVFIVNLILYFSYSNQQKANQTNYLFVNIILSSLTCAINQVLWGYAIEQINRSSVTFTQQKDMKKQLLFFTNILELIKIWQKDEKAYVRLQGLLNQHQMDCKDKRCPCQCEIFIKKYKTEQEIKQDILIEQQAATSIALQEDLRLIKSKAKGIYLFQLSHNNQQYILWLLDFIDYHFTLSIKNLKNDSSFEDFCIKFWHFQCKDKIKHHSQFITEKSLFFKIVQLAMTQLIENKIKEKDKSLRYSYRLKDTQEAIMYERFENFVLCEERKEIIKNDIMMLIEKKIQYNEKLIEGYLSINDLYIDIMELMKYINRVEAILQKELTQSKENIHFIRILSLIKYRFINDPSSCDKLETQLYELKRRDEFQDKNIVHSLTVLKGNVVSIIASFGGKEKGLILSFSERTPQFFGYQSSEFYQINSVKQLMPMCLSREHDLFISRLIEQGTQNILRSYRTALAKKKDGFLFPIKIYVNYYFGLQNDLCFSSLVLKLQTNSHYILLDYQGFIQGVSEGFYNPITAELYEEEHPNLDIIKSNIRLFCPSISSLIDKYSDTQDHANFRCEFYLPRKYSELLKNFQQELRVFESLLEKQEQQNKKLNKQKEFNRFMQEFIKKNKAYYEGSTLQYELSINVEQDYIKLIDGRQLILYVLEITSFIYSDKDLTSTLGTTQATKTIVFQKIYTQGDDDELNNRNPLGNIINNSNMIDNNNNIFSSQFTVKKNQNQYLQENDEEDSNFGSAQQVDIIALQDNQNNPNTEYQIQIPYTQINPQQQQQQQQQGKNQSDIHVLNSPQTNNNNNNNTGRSINKQTSFGKTQNNNNYMTNSSQNTGNQKRLSSILDFYQRENIQKLYSDLGVQRDEILKEIQKAEKEEENSKQQNDNDCHTPQSRKSVYDQSQEKKNEYARQNSDKNKAEILVKGPQVFQEYKLSNIDDQFEDNRLTKHKDTRAQMLVFSTKEIDFPQIPQVKLHDQRQYKKECDEKQDDILQTDPNSPKKQEKFDLNRSIRKYSVCVNPLINLTQSTNKYTSDQLINLKSPNHNNNISNINFNHNNNNVSLNNSQILSNQNLRTIQQGEITMGVTDMNNTFVNESNCLNRSQQQYEDNYDDQQIEGEIKINNEEFTDDTGNRNEYISELENDNDSKGNNCMDNRQHVKDNRYELNSVNSTELKSTINAQIKQIHQRANSRQSPLFLKMLFSLFVIQWFLFIIMISIQLVLIFSNFTQIKQNLERILLMPQVIIPISKSILSLNYQVFGNDKFIDLSQIFNNQNSNYILNENTYFYELVKSSYNNFYNNVENTLLREIIFSYESDMMDEEIDIILTAKSLSSIYDLSIQEVLTLISQSLHHLSISESYNSVNSIDPQLKTLQDNFYTIYTTFSDINQSIVESLSNSFKTFSQFNSINLGISLVIIITSYIFIIPSFQRVNYYLQNILKLISRISEKEAQEDIHMLYIFQDQLESTHEEYLTCSVCIDLDKNAKLIKQKSQVIANNKQKQRKVGQYLCDRIKDQNISQTSFCLLILLLFLICSVFFIAEFILIKMFISSSQPPSESFEKFYLASTGISASAATHNLLYKHQFYTNYNQGKPYFTDQIYQNLTSLFQSTYLSSHKFFSEDFLKFKDDLSSLSNEFQDEVQFLSKNEPCNSNSQFDLFSTLENKICFNALSGTVNKGLSASLQTIFNYLSSMKVDNNNFDYDFSKQFINTQPYKEQIQVIQLDISLLEQIIIQFKQNILNVMDNSTNLIIIVFAIGAITYSIFFFRILIQFLDKLFSNFKLVRKGVMLIPFKRVCEDNNTLSLIKKYI